MCSDLRAICIELIKEANLNGCRKEIASKDCGLCIKTIERWEKNLIDLRNGPKTIPANKLSEFERKKIIKIATSEKYRDKSPWEIVPMLADSEGIFIGSESSFYRVLKKEKLLAHRGKK
ncbi:MAG: hypothetical protein HOP07_05685 [Bacteriovoracaceae bacterium]|nr:hypothetical protein [Bacteriovoracaceae bacterium]